jgi:outer membrane receptor protein involved in Fe transport
MNKCILILTFLLTSMLVHAQSGLIAGKVLDEKGETVLGATVSLEGHSKGGKTDLDGKFSLRGIADGKYIIKITYVGYEAKLINDIEVKQGKSEFINITLIKASKSLKEVKVTKTVKRESVSALLIQQKNLSTISDGISGETIKKTADRNTAEILKRVSGVTIVENKFPVIRGLADRYNMAMLNGDILPSSESDRKAFSFDIFPSTLVENMVIVKAATPDRPAEFSGGLIDLTTKGIQTESFLNIQIGTGMNNQSTFRPYRTGRASKTDWLGYDKTMRVLPADFPTRSDYDKLTTAQKVDQTKKFRNTWGTSEMSTMLPFQSLAISGAYVKNLKKDYVFGVSSAVTYSRNNRTYFIDRNELNGSLDAYKFIDTSYRESLLIGSLLNFGLKIKDKHKLNFKNSFTLNADDNTIVRSGDFIDNEQFIRGSALWFANNQLLSNQLSGDHVFTKRNIRLNWGLARQQIERQIPDLRRTNYTKNYIQQDSLFRSNITTIANPNLMGRFFANTSEVIYNGHFDLSLPYKIKGQSQLIKVGTYLQTKSRSYDARVLGYVKAKSSTFDNSLLSLPEDQIFDEANIKPTGFIISDATLPTDNYEASSNLKAYYLMNDNLLLKKIRLVYGVRLENFQQELITGISARGDKKINKSNIDWLPSLNLTYALDAKTNLRMCASKTLSRPEFRELSPATFYDFNLLANTTGNPDLEQTIIQNYDFRYEYYLGKGEMITTSVFIKKFKNAIESTIPYGFLTTQKLFNYTNAADASSFGLELEFRKGLDFLSHSKSSIFKQLSLFGNFAYIKSEVRIETQTASGDMLAYKRPMQGQSPYIINTGLSWQDKQYNTQANLIFNRIGQRLFIVGNGEIPDMYEAPRNILDFSISHKFYKNKLEVKFTISDIFANPYVYYYNVDESYKIVSDEARFTSEDFTVIRNRVGTNFGLSLSYQIK